MVTKIVSIGNSKGIRIPSAILKQCNITDTVELEIHLGAIVIKPIKHDYRVGWGEAFKLMSKRGQDKLILDESIDAEFNDWEW
jgi:antitoxin MazE